MKKVLFFILFFAAAVLCLQAKAQIKTAASKLKYDTIIRLHVDKKPKKAQAIKTLSKTETSLPVPEFINQPYYHDADGNRLIKLESAVAQLITKKKVFGLKGARQFLSMDGGSSKVRFTAKKDISFIIKTSGDVIDLTSYIKLYEFVPVNQKREVTLTAKEGMLNDKEEQKGKLLSIGVKMISKDNYMIQLPDQLAAGEYGFVWVKNMELKEFTVFNFGIDWKSSD